MKLFSTILRRIVHDIVMVLAPKKLKKLIMSCQEVSQILATKPELTVKKKMFLKMHILICECCTNYSKELDMISKQTKIVSAPKLTEDQKLQIKNSQQELINRFKK